MVKVIIIKIKLFFMVDIGFFYVIKKNFCMMMEKMVKWKYDLVVKKYVEFKEVKIK